MEEYEDMESDALVAYNAIDGTDAIPTTTGQEQEGMSEMVQITGVPDLETEGRKLRNTGVLKATSGNAAKRKSKTETRHSTKGSTSLTALKMIAKQGADEKSLLEEWKTDLLDKLTTEIAQIHKVHNIAMEAQREEIEGQKKQFQFEIHVLGERIRALELEKKELVQRQTCRSESVNQDKKVIVPPTPKPMVPPILRPIKEVKTTKPVQKSYAQIAASSPTRGTKKSWIEVIGKNQKRKNTTPNSPKLESEKRRIIFRRDPTAAQKSEVDLMLMLNESLQKAGIPTYI